ncbi:hypothetical protein RRG08_002446 [Elysia crispata]|uniref:Peptidase S1 domain-containing protein n=1 Tax=Elysia crispata TaxID=231223 RepID=A0AAE1A876_9GAST|nr:hypothetical protein RRG08_002446 [Elysia crispata]
MTQETTGSVDHHVRVDDEDTRVGDGPGSPGSSSPTPAVSPKDVVVTFNPSGEGVSKVVTAAVTPSTTAALSEPGNVSINNNNNHYSADFTPNNENNKSRQKVSSSAAAAGQPGPVSSVFSKKKLWLGLLLILVLLVVAALITVIKFGAGDKSHSSEEVEAGMEGTWRLRGNQKDCPSGYFDCSIGECKAMQFVCDGYPDCANGRDEKIGCECTADQFRCASGQCVSADAVCNKIYDCLDYSDEANCANCPLKYRCKSNDVCLWSPWSICNGILNCDDFSDELNCTDHPGKRRCSNGLMVERELFCDGLDDCGDNSDEENCSYCQKTDQFLCSSAGGRCIPDTWSCDGHYDCTNGEDEQNCDNCAVGQFVCADYSCIEVSLRCDGKVDCGPHGDDEVNCLSLSPDGLLLTLTTTGQSEPERTPGVLTRVPVCADGWSDKVAAQACSLIGAKQLDSWKVVKIGSLKAAMALVQTTDLSAPFLSNLKTVNACRADQVVHLSCKELECGARKVAVFQSLIARGKIVPPGKWPWVVSLSYLSKPICGGVVIGPRWVLTAAHCIKSAAPGRRDVDFTVVPFYFTVTAGTTHISESGASFNKSGAFVEAGRVQESQTIRVANIFLHPDVAVMRNGILNWDMALLELEGEGKSETQRNGRKREGFEYSELIQPICLPSQGEDFPTSSHCYIAGWGLLNSFQNQRVHDQRDTRMLMWSESTCKNINVHRRDIVDTNSTICGGFAHSQAPTACQGDSGGPLMCLDPRSGRYKLAGIISQGATECGGEFLSRRTWNRFARVARAADWIKGIMGNS